MYIYCSCSDMNWTFLNKIHSDSLLFETFPFQPPFHFQPHLPFFNPIPFPAFIFLFQYPLPLSAPFHLPASLSFVGPLLFVSHYHCQPPFICQSFYLSVHLSAPFICQPPFIYDLLFVSPLSFMTFYLSAPFHLLALYLSAPFHLWPFICQPSFYLSAPLSFVSPSVPQYYTNICTIINTLIKIEWLSYLAEFGTNQAEQDMIGSCLGSPPQNLRQELVLKQNKVHLFQHWESYVFPRTCNKEVVNNYGPGEMGGHENFGGRGHTNFEGSQESFYLKYACQYYGMIVQFFLHIQGWGHDKFLHIWGEG